MDGEQSMDVDGDGDHSMDVDCHGNNDLPILLSGSEDHRELTTADSDLDLAFQQQKQSSSSSSHQRYSPLNEGQDLFSGTAENFIKSERERNRRELIDSLKIMKENLNRLKHDQAFALQIPNVPDADLARTGDSFEMPYASFPSSSEDIFGVYFRGLVSDETVVNVEMSFAGIGVAICDESDCCLYESRKSFLISGTEGEDEIVELKALIEALNSAVTLGLKRVEIYCNMNSVYQYLIGYGKPTDHKIATLVNHLNLIETKFTYFRLRLEKQNTDKFAHQLAKDAILSHINKLTENTSRKKLIEQCTICFESTYIGQMFSVNKCQHRCCFSCMRMHIEAKLHQGKLPKCPHEECKSYLEIETCESFLNKKLNGIIRSQSIEASIIPREKVYCPFSSCSALMSKTELRKRVSTPSASSQESCKRKCVECHRLFCIKCNVAWHDKMTCCEFMESFEYKSSNEAKVKSSARTWLN